MGKLIGFMGAGGTGKTTTAKLLVEELGKEWNTQSSVARGVLERWGIDEAGQAKLSPQDTLKLQMEIWQGKNNMDAVHYASILNYVCDRTPIDNYAYLIYRCGQALTESVWMELRRRTVESLKRYSLIFRFPLVTYPSTDDGVRDTAFGVRLCLDNLMQHATYTDFWADRPNVITVPPGTVHDRVQYVLSAMEFTK